MVNFHCCETAVTRQYDSACRLICFDGSRISGNESRLCSSSYSSTSTFTQLAFPCCHLLCNILGACKYTSSSVAYFGYCHDHDPITNHQCTSLNRKQLDPLTWIFQSTTIVPVFHFALTPCPSSSVSCEPELPNYLPTSSYLRPHIV